MFCAGPTLATSGLALQVPLAVVADAVLKDPQWLHSLGTAVLTLAGAIAILAAFFGLNITSSASEDPPHGDRGQADERAPLAQRSSQEGGGTLSLPSTVSADGV